ncbi:anti-sigma-V factor rsiV [Paenibacillus sp. JCM 10914]|uniref:anti-sigma-V factor rsiV n=1 Tax=Paenibacillus sp. JCM 10914 TaxID=1236974 RepID=UPI0003CC966A|nr:anti-sigma-V factor rsiV [Paenibacillus sp. JCM 10914]GAE06006.1 anti-sigma factor homolog yrhM [Paenibacillus sp. JCM 10914]
MNKTIAARRRKNKSLSWLASVTAACILLIAGVNTSPAFAQAMSDVPVLGNLFKVVTVRDYAERDEQTEIHMETPGIVNLGDEELEQALNSKYLTENKQLYETFKDEVAALKEGGGHLGLDSGYEVVTDNEQLLTLRRYVVEFAGGSAESRQYDTIDKVNHIVITLPSLFKDESYISAISDHIKQQMREQMSANPDKIYWVEQPDAQPEMPEDQFKSITMEQSFYINPEGKLVISFNEYDVAPGYMGVVEFTIPTEAIADLLVSHEYIK